MTDQKLKIFIKMYLKSRKNNIIIRLKNLEFKKKYYNKNKIWELEVEEVFRK